MLFLQSLYVEDGYEGEDGTPQPHRQRETAVLSSKRRKILGITALLITEFVI